MHQWHIADGEETYLVRFQRIAMVFKLQSYVVAGGTNTYFLAVFAYATIQAGYSQANLVNTGLLINMKTVEVLRAGTIAISP
jgi:uncharacterized oligopeptide transporter (OPT) family protein